MLAKRAGFDDFLERWLTPSTSLSPVADQDDVRQTLEVAVADQDACQSGYRSAILSTPTNRPAASKAVRAVPVVVRIGALGGPAEIF